MNNGTAEFLNGLITAYGYYYLDEQQIVEIALDNDIEWDTFSDAVHWLEKEDFDAFKEEYDFATK